MRLWDILESLGERVSELCVEIDVPLWKRHFEASLLEESIDLETQLTADIPTFTRVFNGKAQDKVERAIPKVAKTNDRCWTTEHFAMCIGDLKQGLFDELRVGFISDTEGQVDPNVGGTFTPVDDLCGQDVRVGDQYES